MPSPHQDSVNLGHWPWMPDTGIERSMPATVAGLPLPMNPLPQPADYCSTSNIEAIAKALTGRRIVILGLARQGLALARFFCSCGANVAVSDLASADTLQAELAALGDLPVELALGSHPLSLLDGCDLLCLSGGVPPQSAFVAEAAARDIPLSNDSLLSLQIAKALDLGPAVAITGSSGKTTTTTLTGEMLAGPGRTVHVGGNIGTPLLDRLDTVQRREPIVLELSSFQLELFDPALAWGRIDQEGPSVGAILNITPNHLDRHPSMAAYAAAKLNLLRSMPAGARLIVNLDDPVTASLAGARPQRNASSAAAEANHAQAIPDEWNLEPLLAEARALIRRRKLRLIPFSSRQRLTFGAWLEDDTLMLHGRPICRRQDVKLRGNHNISNLLAAAAISHAAGADLDTIRRVAQTFAGVPHRLEVVAQANGITWINDSIATSPERAIAGLRSFPAGEQTLILLAGGKDKNLPWDTFAAESLARVSFLIGFGHSGSMIVNAVKERARFGQQPIPGYAVVQRLDEAVELAARMAPSNSVVLLSPGGTSFDAYRNFEERGEHFRRLVTKLLENHAQASAGQAGASENSHSG
ncbi:MAG: Mur ligase family protein [Chloroflexota bacterium]|nr:Mur ligase family protein [Chloroflexota bacterium]